MKFSLKLVLTLFILAGLNLESIAALSVEKITVFEYMLNVIEVKKLVQTASALSDKSVFTEGMKKFPQAYLVSLPPGKSRKKEMKVNWAWLHNYFSVRAVTGNSENLPGDPFLILEKTLEAEEENIRKIGEFSPDDEAAIAKAKEILSEKIYDFTEKKIVDEENETEKSGSGTEIRKGLDFGFNAIVFIVVLIVILLAVLRLAKFLDFRKAGEKAEIPIPGGLLKEDDPRDSERLGKLALEYFEKGELDKAIRYYYLSFIIYLNESNIIRYKASFTNWEYYRAMVSKSFPKNSAYRLTVIFDESHYGGKEVSPAEFERFSDALSRCKDGGPGR